MGVIAHDESSQIQIRGIARAGCGTSEFVSGASLDHLERAVTRQLGAAKTQGIQGIALQWNYKHSSSSGDKNPLHFLSTPFARGLQKLPIMHMPPITENSDGPDNGSEPDSDFLSLWREGYVTSPFKIPPVFSGEHLLVFTLFKTGHETPSSLTLVANCPTRQTWTIPVNPAEFLEGHAIHAMAARALVEDLDGGRSLLHDLKADKQTIEVEMIETSCR